MMRTFTSIVLSGGEFKSITMIGVIQYLEEHNMIGSIRTLVGSSAGSIICFLLALGYTSEEMKTFFYDVTNDENINDFDITGVCNIMDTYGVNSGENLILIFEKALFKKTYRNDISFLEFTKMTGKNLVVCVSNLSKECSEFWSVDTQPALSVFQALKASCSIPLIFQPVRLNDMLYIDGGVYNNFPISYFKDTHLRDIIGVNIYTKNYQNTDTFMNYIRFILYSTLNSHVKNIIKSHHNDVKNNIITIELLDDHLFSLEHMRFDISRDIIEKYVKVGYEYITKEFADSYDVKQ
jgi:predicted acylesterase/phospholipase RssA